MTELLIIIGIVFFFLFLRKKKTVLSSTNIGAIVLVGAILSLVYFMSGINDFLFITKSGVNQFWPILMIGSILLIIIGDKIIHRSSDSSDLHNVGYGHVTKLGWLPYTIKYVGWATLVATLLLGGPGEWLIEMLTDFNQLSRCAANPYLPDC